MFTSSHSPSIISKPTNFQITAGLCIAACLAAHLCFWILPGLLMAWDTKVIDGMFLLRSASSYHRPAYNDTIVHVDINDTTLKQLHSFYIKRKHFAKAIENMAEMGIAAQVFDFIFAEKTDATEDQAMIRATEKAGNVYFGLAFNLNRKDGSFASDDATKNDMAYLEKTKWYLKVDGNAQNLPEGTRPLMTFAELAEKAKGVGFLNLRSDTDGVNRRMPLLFRFQDAFYPSLAFRCICDYLGVSPDRIILRPGKSLTLTGAHRPTENGSQDIVIPIDSRGDMLINLIGAWEAMKHYNFVDIFYADKNPHKMNLWREELGGKIVVVSEVATGTADIVPVPTDTNFLASGLHANMLHAILQASFLRKLTMTEALGIEITMLLLIIFLAFRLTTIPFALSMLGLGAVIIGLSMSAFLYFNLIFYVIRPLLGLAFGMIAIVVYNYMKEAEDRRFVRSTFGSYLSNEVVEELLGKAHALEMGGETREVTFLVSDIRGFTELSSRVTPENVIRLLNRYLEFAIETITSYRGTINDLQGDGILVFFGAPLREGDDLERAIACAVQLQNRMPEINTLLRRERLPEVSMGIGINTGQVVVGNIGSRKFRTYSAIGDPINTAYRIESCTTGGQILISDESYQKIGSKLVTKGQLTVQLKGLKEPLTLHEVHGIRGKYDIFLAEDKVEKFLPIRPHLSITCFTVEDKTVSSEILATGHLIKRSKSGACAVLNKSLDLHTDLKIDLVDSQKSRTMAIYAKVAQIISPREVHLVFTSISDEARSFLDRRVKN